MLVKLVVTWYFMLDLVLVCLTIVGTIGALLVILLVSYKKIIPFVIKKTMAGYMSGFSRNQKAVKKEIARVMLDKTLIGPILDMVGLGEIRGYLAKHPDALFTVAQIAGPYIEKYIDGVASGGVALDTSIPITEQPLVLSLAERIKTLQFP